MRNRKDTATLLDDPGGYCAICGSDRHVDKHHYDCRRGQISKLTIPLCRRCHMTYHDFGVECFSPDTTERAIDVENVRRGLFKIPPLTIDMIARSRYWQMKWGVINHRGKKCPQAGAEDTKQLTLF